MEDLPALDAPHRGLPDPKRLRARVAILKVRDPRPQRVDVGDHVPLLRDDRVHLAVPDLLLVDPHRGAIPPPPVADAPAPPAHRRLLLRLLHLVVAVAVPASEVACAATSAAASASTACGAVLSICAAAPGDGCC